MADTGSEPSAPVGGADGEPGEPTRSVAVRELLDDAARHLGLRLVTGRAGLDRTITYPRIQKASLAVTGYIDAVHPGRVQLLGRTEVTYLRGRDDGERAELMRRVCSDAPVCCFVVTGGLSAPDELVAAAEAHKIPVLATELMSSVCIDQLQRLLNDRLAPRSTVHGVLVDVYGVGVLLLGESGVGKSECALDLVTRGHRLVSDDVVECWRESTGVLVGQPPRRTQHLMEVRGLGVVNIRQLFGISSIRERKFIELVVLLEPWHKGKAVDRLGLDETRYAILDVELPLLRLPVAAGRNLATLIEVATRNQLAKLRGQHAARQLVERVERDIASASDSSGGWRAVRAPSSRAAGDDAEGES